MGGRASPGCHHLGESLGWKEAKLALEHHRDHHKTHAFSPVRELERTDRTKAAVATSRDARSQAGRGWCRGQGIAIQVGGVSGGFSLTPCSVSQQ